MELARRGDQPLPRPRPHPLAATGPQPHRPALGVHPRAAGDAGRRTGALQPHQPGLSPAEGIRERNPAVGTDPRRRARLEAGGLFLAGVRRPRVGAHLFRRSGRALRRPHQERQRAGRAAGGHRAVLRPGLFQAASRHQRLAARRVSRHEGREPADGARPGHRRQADHRPHRHPHRQAAGQGVADARRPGATCTCWIATCRATAPRTAS